MAFNRHASGGEAYGHEPYRTGSYGNVPAQPSSTALAPDPADDFTAAYGQYAPYDPRDQHDEYAAYGQFPAYYGPERDEDEPYGEWNPSTETLRPVRGRHRVARQRGGSMARSRAVLGVGVIAAVGAGGMATATEGGAPGVADAAQKVKSMGSYALSGGQNGDSTGETTAVISAAPLTSAGLAITDPAADPATGTEEAPGEALRSRILAQAESQDAIAATERRDAAVDQAIAGASEEAANRAEQERIEAEEKQRAEEERKRKAEEERKRKAEEERLRQLRASYTSPLSNYTLSATYGQAGPMWASGYHTGLDFAAPAGTPIKNIHTGTVKEAAWAGSYGYRVVIELSDGTELSYSHMSSMSVVAGQEVITGEVIGNVGSTGQSSGPHLHLEVRPGGGATIDPLSWMRNNGVQI